MQRRHVIPALLGAGLSAASSAIKPLSALMEQAQGSALLIDIRDRRLIAAHNPTLAAASPALPGSTMKPFALAELLRLKRITAQQTFVCPQKLTIGGRAFNCSHLVMGTPMRVETALAYSCNCFVAHMAQRFQPNELAAEFQRVGLSSRSGLFSAAEAAGQIRAANDADSNQLQAIGEDCVTVTLAQLAMGYRTLAMNADASILTGLEGAVEYGTAQLARVDAVTVAGKTGSVRRATGGQIAWFAGFMPSRAPQVVVAVMLHGRSGGGDAAPVGGRILTAYQAGRL